MNELFAYTDGACSGNPGPGGWGVLLLARNGDTILKKRELQGGEAETTNNRMELLAAISALFSDLAVARSRIDRSTCGPPRWADRTAPARYMHLGRFLMGWSIRRCMAWQLPC